MKTYVKPTLLVIDVYYSDDISQPELHVGSNFNPDEQEILVKEYNEWPDDNIDTQNNGTSNMWDNMW